MVKRPRLWRIFSGLSDLTLSIASGVLILLLLIMLSSLVRWVVTDFNTTFAGLTRDINDALVMETQPTEAPQE